MFAANILPTNGLLLAETLMSDVSLQFREEKQPEGWNVSILLVIVGVLVAVGVAVAYRIFMKSNSKAPSANGLFCELFDVHNLDRQARTLLDRVTEAAGLKQPAMMMVSTEFYDATVRKAYQKRKFRKSDQQKIVQIRKQLFMT